MPRHKIVYDPVLKETPEWQYLYNRWSSIKKQPHSSEFDVFSDFYNWAMADGFVLGERVVRIDDQKPYSPENCLLFKPAAKPHACTTEEAEWIALWNRTVNRIRVHYGMEPIGQQ